MQRKAFPVEVRAQLPITHARRDSHGTCVRIQRDHLVHRFQGKEIMGAVCDLIEAGARAEHLQFVVLPNKFLHLFKRVSGVQMFGTVLDIGCPVLQFCPLTSRQAAAI